MPEVKYTKGECLVHEWGRKYQFDEFCLGELNV